MDKDLQKIVDEVLKKQPIERELFLKKYPRDVPNNVCEYAAIPFFSIENSFGPKKGDFNYLFSTEYEDLYVWTYEKNKYSILVTKVNLAVKEIPFWKTAARLIQLAFSLANAFEYICEPTDYKWMYYFVPGKSSFDEVFFYDLDRVNKSNVFECAPMNLKLTRISHIASLIELFERDDVAYNSVSSLVSSFVSHPCSVIYETEDWAPDKYKDKEPNVWNYADKLPNLETAILQACRSIESILGDPGRHKKGSYRYLTNWNETLNFKPDDIFQKAGRTYFDYYRSVFNERDPSAHGQKQIRYSLMSKKVTEIQCFAALILRDYVQKHMLSNDEAIKKIHLNQNLLSRVSDTLSTGKTAE